MIRSLYSGVSGLTNHQTKMDVIGNNIANVNTYGFKASKAIFKDIFYQTVNSPSAGTAATAGNNPATVGYGVQIADIKKDMSMSNLQSTGRTLDMAVSGEGFFITATFPMTAADPAQPNLTNYVANDPSYTYDKTSAITYTRMGNMGIDSYGNLVADSNVFLLGTRNTAAGLAAIGNDSAAELTARKLVDTNGDNKVNAQDLTYDNVININKLIQEAYNVHTDPESGFFYTYLGTEITDPVTGEKTYDRKPVIDPDTGVDTYINPVYCDKTGKPITTSTAADPSDPTSTGKAEYIKVVDYATLTDAAARTAKTKELLEAGAIQGELTFKDLGSFTIDKLGVITTNYNNEAKAIARIELAVFDNPEGLIEAGNTSYSETPASGEASIKRPKEEGAGNIEPGRLEMSNVNLANEFSDMIVTQRGFQANSRIITVSDSMLEELVNLKR